MKKNNLTEAYQRLKKEVLAYTAPAFGDEQDPSEIDSKSIRTIIKEIETVTGISRPLSEKTLRRYFQASNFDANANGIDYLAAIWLIANKALSKEECKTHFKENTNRSSSYYWNEYLLYISGKKLVDEPGPVPEDERTQITFDDHDLSSLNEIFIEPEFGNLVQRENCLQRLLELLNQHRLIVVDGISGAGKKCLIKTLQSRLLHSGRYRKIFWKYLEGYSLENFLSEIGERIELPGNTTYTKAQQFIDFLKTNQSLVVLYGIDTAQQASFTSFLENLAIGTGNAQLLIIRDHLESFPSIPSKNRMTVHGFTPAEITEFCRLHKYYPPEKVINQIRQISDGLPYHVDLLVRILKLNGEQPDYHHLKTDIESDLDFKIKYWSRNLSEDDIRLLTILCYHGNNISGRDWLSLAKKIGLENPQPHFDKLRHYHIVYPEQGSWKILGPVAEYFSQKHYLKDSAQFHAIVGDHISLAAIPALVNTLNKEQLQTQGKAILHYQQASQFDKSKRYLNSIIPLLKLRNLYPVLYDSLEFEILNNPKQDIWMNWHMAQCCLVLGKLDECLIHVKKCLQVAIRWYEEKIDLENGMSFFIKTLQLFSELIALTSSYADACKLLTTSLSVFKPAEWEWKLRGHALSVLSRYYEKIGQFDQSKQINESLKKEFYASSEQSQAIVFTHLGIVHLNSEELKNAEQCFEQAKELFHICSDERGEAWATAHLVLCGINRHKTKHYPLIPSIIETHESGQICDPDYVKWLETFFEKVQDQELHFKIQTALDSARLSWNQCKQRVSVSEIKIEIDNVLQFLNNYADNEFSIEKLIDPITETQLSLDTALQRSMVREVKRKPEPYLTRLKDLKPEEIFNSPQLNRIILELFGIEALQNKMMSDFILPNLELIRSLNKDFDELKIRFAHRLHVAEEQDHALSLLEAVSQENQNFYYLNTKANCLRKKGDNRCDDYYELAGFAASSDKERGIHNHNLAIRIYEAEMKEQYAEAKQYCKNSIDLRQEDWYFVKYPINTLVLLEIETASVEDVISVVNRLRKTYNIYNSWLHSIIREVRSKAKKRKLQTEFPGRAR